MSKKLYLEDVLAGIGPIVQASPKFIYPQQEDQDDMRCKCIEQLVDDDPDREIDEEFYDYSDCQWHLDDDNTCRYVKKNGDPACVVGHYFIKELGFTDMWNWETKAPGVVLEKHGYIAEKRAVRFLNTIQQMQDQGWEWDQAYDHAIQEVDRHYA